MKRQAQLIDRFIISGQHILRVQHYRTGECFDVYVPENMTQHAGCIWGGNPVDYILRDGRAVFQGGENIPEDYEFQFWAESVRKKSPAASEESLREIYDTPMSYKQRQAAIAALAK